MVHSLLPMFLVGTLGASVLAVGLIEGVAEVDGADRQGLLRRAERLPRPAQGPGAAGLRPGCADQAAVRARQRCRPGGRGALRSTASARAFAARRATRWWPTSRRRRSAARPSGCASRWTPSAPSSARCWPSALMLLWANDFRAVFWVAVIPGCAGRAAAGRRRARAALRPRARCAATRSGARRCAGCPPPTGGWWRIGARLHAGTLQRGLPGAARAAAAACRWPGCRW